MPWLTGAAGRGTATLPAVTILPLHQAQITITWEVGRGALQVAGNRVPGTGNPAAGTPDPGENARDAG